MAFCFRLDTSKVEWGFQSHIGGSIHGPFMHFSYGFLQKSPEEIHLVLTDGNNVDPTRHFITHYAFFTDMQMDFDVKKPKGKITPN